MEQETILNKLLKVKDIKDLDKIIEELKVEVYNDSKAFSSTRKQANKKALSFIKKNKVIKELQYCDFQNGYQVFTDTYTLFALKDYFELPKLPNDLVYRDIMKLMPSETNGQLMKNSKEFLEDNIKKVKAKQFENEGHACMLKTKSYETWVNMERLKTITEILGTTDLDIYIYGKLKNVLFVDKKNGNKALLSPMRMPK